jgi:hypothetical protein
MTNEDFLQKLEDLIVHYDRTYGPYPKHEYEGYEFYAFVCEEFGVDFDPRGNLDKLYPELYE